MQITLPDLPRDFPCEPSGATSSRYLTELDDEKLEALYRALCDIMPAYRSGFDFVSGLHCRVESIFNRVVAQKAMRLSGIVSS